MREWRLIRSRQDSGAMQMALDEAILHARTKGIVPNTLRFYYWKPPAVTIGYFQSLEQEVDVGKAKAAGIDIVRRYTGGGAVFHDKEITYSIVLSEKDVDSDIVKSYHQICYGIVKGLKILGIEARFKPINDIIANGKKISGNAQTRRNGMVLQHGTLLLDVDVDRMFSILKVPDEKIRDKMIQTVKERVTSVRAELGQAVPSKDAEEALLKGFSAALEASFIKGDLTREELSMADLLLKDKYSAASWTEAR